VETAPIQVTHANRLKTQENAFSLGEIAIVAILLLWQSQLIGLKNTSIPA
jgi:hypothetical protein